MWAGESREEKSISKIIITALTDTPSYRYKSKTIIITAPTDTPSYRSAARSARRLSRIEASMACSSACTLESRLVVGWWVGENG